MELVIHQVAAFTSRPFEGNPAAVVPLETWIDDSLMQKIAAENNLSETAFFVPTGEAEWHVRWFTPAVEVPLCGHATLATAAVIRRKLNFRDWPITLHSASGPLSVDIDGDSFVLDLPARRPESAGLPDGLEEALGAEVVESYRGGDIYMVVLANEDAVARLEPDFPRLGKLIDHGLIATAPGDDVDFVSRFFAPAIGIDEDPVTGAAHCVSTPYWSERLGMKQLVARQISVRGGHLQCEDCADRIRLKGDAVFFLSGLISV